MLDNRQYREVALDKAEALKEGKAYKIVEEVTGKPLVVKLMDSLSEAEDELLAEFKKLALLSSEPEFGTIIGLATAVLKGNKQTCYLMDYIEGKSLEKFLQEIKFLEIDIAFDFISQITSGLEKAHAAGIFHSDLHEENILVDSFYNIKIIDPLWREIGTTINERQSRDVKSFQRIAKSIFDKIEPNDLGKTVLIRNVCNQVQSFRGMKKTLDGLWEISKELDLISERGLGLLATIQKHTIRGFKLNMVIREEDVLVPESFIPDLTDTEKHFLEPRTSTLKLEPSESRGERIYYSTLGPPFDIAFHELSMAGLCTYTLGVYVEEGGKKLLGPYRFTYDIKLTFKSIRWFEVHRKHIFLPSIIKQDIHTYIFENYVNI